MIRAWLIIVQIPADERQIIVDSFKDTSNIKKVVADGVHINGEKYVTLESTDDSLKAKKVGNQIFIELAFSRLRNSIEFTY
jgi:hypothetical protein